MYGEVRSRAPPHGNSDKEVRWESVVLLFFSVGRTERLRMHLEERLDKQEK